MQKPGPTGSYASGKPLDDADQGGLFVSLSRVPNERALIMSFGVAVHYLMTQSNQARMIARGIREDVMQCFGTVESADTIEPVKVIAYRDQKLIRVVFLQPYTYLIGEPEVFQAFADHLDEAAKVIDE